MRVKTIQITTPHGHSVINATDYDPEVHTLYQPDTEFTGEKVRELEAKALPPVSQEEREAEGTDEAMEAVEGEALTPSPIPQPSLSEEETARRASVEIPDDWQEAHWKTNVALAQEITGDGSLTTKDEAVAVIGGEVFRRTLPERPLETTDD